MSAEPGPGPEDTPTHGNGRRGATAPGTGPETEMATEPQPRTTGSGQAARDADEEPTVGEGGEVPAVSRRTGDAATGAEAGEAGGESAAAAPAPDTDTDTDGERTTPDTDTDTDGKRTTPDTDTDEEPIVTDAISAPDAEGEPRRVTRRFPMFTRDTARPEGGGRAAPRDAPAPARQWPILVVLCGVGLGLLLTALDVFRWGTVLVGAALLAGAVLRWVLPDVGMLAVRSRFTDMVTYGVIGAAIVLLALMAQPKPLLEIPFLDDTLHFTVGER